MTTFDVTLTGSALSEAAQWAAALTPRSPTDPVIQGALLVADDFQGGTFTIAATDHDTSGQLALADPEVHGHGRRLVSARLLADIARTIAKEPRVQLVDSDDGHRLNVSAGRGAAWSLPLMPAEDYPQLPTPVTPVARVNAGRFSKAVERVSLALAESTVHPFYGGIVLDGTQSDTLAVVAGSSWRLAIADLDWTPAVSDAVAEAKFPAVLVPAPVLAAAIAAARSADPDDDLTLHSDSVTFAVSGGGYHVVGRIGAAVPPWRQGDMTTRLDRCFGHVDVTTTTLRTALDRVAVALEPKEPIALDVSTDQLDISSSAGTKAAAAHQVEVLDSAGDPCRYGLNLGYTRDLVACLAEDEIRLEFIGKPEAPMTLARPIDDTGEVIDGIRMSLAPVKLPEATARAA